MKLMFVAFGLTYAMFFLTGLYTSVFGLSALGFAGAAWCGFGWKFANERGY